MVYINIVIPFEYIKGNERCISNIISQSKSWLESFNLEAKELSLCFIGYCLKVLTKDLKIINTGLRPCYGKIDYDSGNYIKSLFYSHINPSCVEGKFTIYIDFSRKIDKIIKSIEITL